MTREQQLIFCKNCQNKKFNRDKGIVCALTDDIARFENKCADFKPIEVVDSATSNSFQNIEKNAKAATTVIVILLIGCFVDLQAAISGFFEFELLERIAENNYYTEDEIDKNDTRQMIFGLVQFIIYLITIVTFLMWFTRAYKNLKLLGVQTNNSTSMATWSFFIPILSLFKPYQIAKEIAKETKKLITDNFAGISKKTIIIINCWWALFLIDNWVSTLAFKSSNRLDTIDDYIYSTKLFISSDILSLLAGIGAIIFIKTIAGMESQLYNKYNLFSKE